MLAITFGILASVCFAAATLFAQRAMVISPTIWGAWLTLIANTVFLFAVHFILFRDAPIFDRGNLIFAGIGLFVPGLTRVLTFRGIRTMGSAITATIVNTTPMLSTALAVLLLHERPGPLILFGVLLIVSGLATISWQPGQTCWKRSELIYPFLAAFFFAGKDVTVRWGMAGNASPALAAGIAAATSTLAVTLLNLSVYRERFALPPRSALNLFLLSGFCTGGSFLFMYIAFSMESVAIVAPLINSYAVFVLLLAPLMAREIEELSTRKIMGAAFVVAGIFLISAGKG
jgi:drug/metabolite transporter (DMT)-like permease